MLERREKTLLIMFERREQELQARLRAAEDRVRTTQYENDGVADCVHRLEVRNLQLTTESVQRALDDANTWIQALELSHVEEVTGQLEETVLKVQAIMASKSRDEVAFATPPLSQYGNWLNSLALSPYEDLLPATLSAEYEGSIPTTPSPRTANRTWRGDSPSPSQFTPSEAGDTPSVYTLSPEWGASPTKRGGTVLVPETPQSTQGSVRLSGQKRRRSGDRGHTTQQLSARGGCGALSCGTPGPRPLRRWGLQSTSPWQTTWRRLRRLLWSRPIREWLNHMSP